MVPEIIFTRCNGDDGRSFGPNVHLARYFNTEYSITLTDTMSELVMLQLA